MTLLYSVPSKKQMISRGRTHNDWPSRGLLHRPGQVILYMSSKGRVAPLSHPLNVPTWADRDFSYPIITPSRNGNAQTTCMTSHRVVMLTSNRCLKVHTSISCRIWAEFGKPTQTEHSFLAPLECLVKTEDSQESKPLRPHRGAAAVAMAV